jgi:putative aldouronate transport system permease protein
MLIPLANIISISFSTAMAVDAKKVFIFPVNVTLASWKQIIAFKDIWMSVEITAFATVLGTILALVLNAMLAYPLSKKYFLPGSLFILGIVITMIFKAPVIPYFITVKNLGLYNNFLVLILPHLFVPYNVIIMLSFFRQVPIELEESAVIEGCGYFRLLFKIVLPSSKAVLATLGLFYAVMIWNQFQHPIMFLEDTKLFPLQMKVRQFILQNDPTTFFIDPKEVNRPFNRQTLTAAVIIFSILPIALVYPFIQKYFMKGAMLGSIKG